MEPPEKRVKLVEQAPAPALAPADGGNGNDSGAGVNPYLTDYVTPATPPFAPTDTSTKAGMIAEERAKHGYPPLPPPSNTPPDLENDSPLSTLTTRPPPSRRTNPHHPG